MTKPREKAAQERRAKKAAKTKERRAEYKAKKGSAPDYPVEQFPHETQMFWMAHGVNCLLSDYKEGVWSPLFEGLYDGTIPASVKDIQQHVMSRYEGKKDWPPEAKAALAWTVSSPKLLYVYWHEAMRRMQRSHPDLEPEEVAPLIRRPADPCVWDLFHYLMRHLLQRKAI